jgi:hypothetical protein
MAPMLIRLEGAVAPKTELGTMAGNPTAIAVEAEVLRKVRREAIMDRSPES